MIEKIQYYFTEFELFRIQDVGVTISHIVVAFLSLLVALAVSKAARYILKKRLFRRMEIDAGLEYAMLRFIHYAILGAGIYVGLTIINIPLGALVGVVALLGVGIGFGLQNLTSNFISGIILLLERPVKVGDRVEVDGVWGDVQKIKLRTTVVLTPDNISIIVPNSNLLENKLINYYHSNRDIRLHVPVGVAYGSDVKKVTEILEKAALEDGKVLENKPPKVWFLEFGSSSLNFELLCWIPDAALKYDVLNRLNRRIDEEFRKAGVEIPFPQQDLHIRSVETSIPIQRKEN